MSARVWLASTAAVLLVLSACEEDAAITPVAGGQSGGAGGPADAGSDAPTAQPMRTVMQRNPFGNVAKTENLLWDGDFEWSSPFADQYGWINYPQYDYGFTGIRVGVDCRSGLKCAVVTPGDAVIGIAVSSNGFHLAASFWARPLGDGTSCDQVSAHLLSLVGEDADVELPWKAEADDEGWCRFEAVAEERSSKTYLLIENDGDDEVIIDDAVLERVPKTQAISVPAAVPSAQTVAKLAMVRSALRERRPADPPPNAAQRAFERWARGRR